MFEGNTIQVSKGTYLRSSRGYPEDILRKESTPVLREARGRQAVERPLHS